MLVLFIVFAVLYFIGGFLGYLGYKRLLTALATSVGHVSQDEAVRGQETILASYNRLQNEIRQLQQTLPSKILDSVTSSANYQKGKLAELVAYLEIRSKYDAIIPLGGMVDFIGISYGTETEAGRLSFIDVKNGSNARLSKPQQQLKKILDAGNVEFIKIRIDTDVVPPDSGP